jgi:hypothetical protein
VSRRHKPKANPLLVLRGVFMAQISNGPHVRASFTLPTSTHVTDIGRWLVACTQMKTVMTSPARAVLLRRIWACPCLQGPPVDVGQGIMGIYGPRNRKTAFSR